MFFITLTGISLQICVLSVYQPPYFSNVMVSVLVSIAGDEINLQSGQTNDYTTGIIKEQDKRLVVLGSG